MVGGSVFEVTTILVGIEVKDRVVEGSIFEDTVVVGIEVIGTVVAGIEVNDTDVEGSVVAAVTIVEESGSELTLLRGAAPFEGKVAAVVLSEASVPTDSSEEPQAETTSADTNKNTAECFFIETTFFRIREH